MKKIKLLFGSILAFLLYRGIGVKAQGSGSTGFMYGVDGGYYPIEEDLSFWQKTLDFIFSPLFLILFIVASVLILVIGLIFYFKKIKKN